MAPTSPELPAMIAIQKSIITWRSEEHTSELQSRGHLVCRLLLEKKKKEKTYHRSIIISFIIIFLTISLLSTLLLSFFFNDTATTEIYTLSLHERSSDLLY